MDTLAALIFLALIVVALFAGATILIGKFLKFPSVLIYCGAPIIGILGLWFSGAAVIRCSDSYSLSRSFDKVLTPKEKFTLQREELVCPTIYTFERNGEKTCLLWLDERPAVGCG